MTSNFLVFDFFVYVTYFIAVVDFDNTDTAWRKYDPSKNIILQKTSYVIEKEVLILVFLFQLSYCKRAFKTVWMLREAVPKYY